MARAKAPDRATPKAMARTVAMAVAISLLVSMHLPKEAHFQPELFGKGLIFNVNRCNHKYNNIIL